MLHRSNPNTKWRMTRWVKKSEVVARRSISFPKPPSVEMIHSTADVRSSTTAAQLLFEHTNIERVRTDGQGRHPILH